MSKQLAKFNVMLTKITEMTFWVIPAISIFSCAVIFTTSLGYSENIFTFSYLLFAVLFLYIGNYMPKTTRNVTIGIKIKWTIANDENWAATHRLGGKLFFAAGIVMLLGIFLPNSFFLYFLLSVILMITLIPFIYSYCFYKKQLKEGRATKEEYEKSYASLFKGRKPASAISAVLIVLVVVIVIVVLFTGSIETTVGDTALTVEASFWNDLVLDYDDISSIEYREDGISGIRINGFGSPKLSIGIFQNKEIGAHTRYTFNKITPNIIIKTETNIIVINCENEQETKELYNAILEKTSD